MLIWEIADASFFSSFFGMMLIWEFADASFFFGTMMIWEIAAASQETISASDAALRQSGQIDRKSDQMVRWSDGQMVR